MPRSRWPQDRVARRMVLDNWKEPFGDRRQEIVIIGKDMDRAALTASFDACLLSSSEIAAGPSVWKYMPDPFPAWTEEAVS